MLLGWDFGGCFWATAVSFYNMKDNFKQYKYRNQQEKIKAVKEETGEYLSRVKQKQPKNCFVFHNSVVMTWSDGINLNRRQNHMLQQVSTKHYAHPRNYKEVREVVLYLGPRF